MGGRARETAARLGGGGAVGGEGRARQVSGLPQVVRKSNKVKRRGVTGAGGGERGGGGPSRRSRW